MRIEVNMHQAKTELSKLVAQVWEGHEIVITRDGKPVAKLTPYSEEKRIAGQARGQVWISPDFDDPLPDDLLKAFYGIGVDDMLGEYTEEVPDFLKRDLQEDSETK